MPPKDRDVLFANEAFALGMLQAVSGAATVAAVSQFDTLLRHAGRTPLLTFITLTAAALGTAVLAAYWRHQYKLWDVKGQASAAAGNAPEATRRARRTAFYLLGMRYAMAGSIALFLASLTVLVAALWMAAPAPV